MRRAPSTPPELAGYEYCRLLGAGGFSDVFLYEQRLPRRQVAVKVLLADELTATARRAFVDEANLMARLSAHPYIVTIYAADVADGDRPYFVMEYCAGPSLADRYKRERFGLADALGVGVRLSSAIATAHAAGILHRDIKPANVLTNEYGRPALTDFGISSAVDELPVHTTTAGALRAAEHGTTESQSVGMSVPWSPAEMFEDDPQPDVRSDVFSLAATIHTLLAGRTPFELPGRPNGTLDLIGRIERGMVSPIGRPDLPDSLVAVLRKGMALRPVDRYATALEFARALQRVERELGYAPTPIEVPRIAGLDSPTAEGQDLGSGAPPSPGTAGVPSADETRVRGVATIIAQPESSSPAARVGGADADATRVRDFTIVRPDAAADASESTVLRPRQQPVTTAGPRTGAATIDRSTGAGAGGAVVGVGADAGASAGAESEPGAAPGARRRLVPALVGAGALALTAIVVASVVLSGGATRPGPRPTPSPSGESAVVGGAVVPPVFTGAQRSADGTTVTFAFEGVDGANGYIWAPSEQPEAETGIEDPVVVRTGVQPGARVCVQLKTLLSGRVSKAVEGCNPA